MKLFRFKREKTPEDVEKKEMTGKEKETQTKRTLEEPTETDEELLETESEFDIPAFLRRK